VSVLSDVEVSASPTTGSGRGRRFVGAALPPTLLIVGIVLLWQLGSATGFLNPIIVPSPWDVALSLSTLVFEGFFWEAAWITMQETLYGFLIGVVIAWVLGTLMGLSPRLRSALYPVTVGFQIMPRVALAPLFLVWFGFGINSKIAMAATICFFPVVLSVLVGLQTVDEESRQFFRSLGASRWDEYRKLSLPSSLPIIFSGLKNAITLALIGAIVAEFVGAAEGMGVLIKKFNFQLEVANGFASILALMLFGLVLYWIIEILDSRIVFWRGRR
jgi:NitT/TauT family transport system permease protein